MGSWVGKYKYYIERWNGEFRVGKYKYYREMGWGVQGRDGELGRDGEFRVGMGSWVGMGSSG